MRPAVRFGSRNSPSPIPSRYQPVPARSVAARLVSGVRRVRPPHHLEPLAFVCVDSLRHGPPFLSPRQPDARPSVRGRVVRYGGLHAGFSRGRDGRDRSYRLGQRDLQYLVHRLDHVDVEGVEHVLGDVRQVLYVLCQSTLLRSHLCLSIAANRCLRSGLRGHGENRLCRRIVCSASAIRTPRSHPPPIASRRFSPVEILPLRLDNPRPQPTPGHTW